MFMVKGEVNKNKAQSSLRNNNNHLHKIKNTGECDYIRRQLFYYQNMEFFTWKT